MEIRRLFRWVTISSSIFTGLQLYLYPSQDKDPLYAWLLYIVGYLFAELGWPHPQAGFQICIVLQLLSFTFSLSVTSKLSGVDLRFWQRKPEICTLGVVVTHMRGGEREGMMAWDGETRGFWCRTREQQVRRIEGEKRKWEEENQGKRCLRSCVRFEEGRWHLSVDSAPAGRVPLKIRCREGEGELLGRCPGLEGAEPVEVPMKVEWVDG